jgi:DNA replication and repair protein RecF
MRLVRLAAERLRNLAPFELETDARFIVVHGLNGHGKTNLLEAVWLLATLRTLRGTSTRDAVAWGSTAAAISGSVVGRAGTRALRFNLGAERGVRVDGASVRDLGEYFAEIRAVAFTPHDAAILAGGPELRRAWLDRAAFTAAPAHLDVVRAVSRCLAQKASLLRAPQPDLSVLDVLDHELARWGGQLVARRAALLTELHPHIDAAHTAIAGVGAFGLSLRSQAVGSTAAERSRALADRLAHARPEELRRRMCLVGPQRDDLTITLDHHPARTFASRGQVRSIVLALKLAELRAARARGQAPLFLLDDLSSELDAERTWRLVDELRALDAQVWITTTDPGHLRDLPPDERLLVAVAHGRLQHERSALDQTPEIG